MIDSHDNTFEPCESIIRGMMTKSEKLRTNNTKQMARDCGYSDEDIDVYIHNKQSSHDVGDIFVGRATGRNQSVREYEHTRREGKIYWVKDMETGEEKKLGPDNFNCSRLKEIKRNRLKKTS